MTIALCDNMEIRHIIWWTNARKTLPFRMTKSWTSHIDDDFFVVIFWSEPTLEGGSDSMFWYLKRYDEKPIMAPKGVMGCGACETMPFAVGEALEQLEQIRGS